MINSIININLNPKISPPGKKNTHSTMKQITWNYFETYLFESVPEKKTPLRKRTKRFMEAMEGKPLLKECEYSKLIKFNFLASELKSMCKFYKLKISGKKHLLIHRLWNYLKFSYYSIKIQKCFKKY